MLFSRVGMVQGCCGEESILPMVLDYGSFLGSSLCVFCAVAALLEVLAPKLCLDLKDSIPMIARPQESTPLAVAYYNIMFCNPTRTVSLELQAKTNERLIFFVCPPTDVEPCALIHFAQLIIHFFLRMAPMTDPPILHFNDS